MSHQPEQPMTHEIGKRTYIVAEVDPLDTDGVRTVAVGTGLWLVLFLGLLPFYARLRDDGRLWWLWTCLAGFGLGLAGWDYCRRRRRRLEDAEWEGWDDDEGLGTTTRSTPVVTPATARSTGPDRQPGTAVPTAPAPQAPAATSTPASEPDPAPTQPRIPARPQAPSSTPAAARPPAPGRPVAPVAPSEAKTPSRPQQRQSAVPDPVERPRSSDVDPTNGPANGAGRARPPAPSRPNPPPAAAGVPNGSGPARPPAPPRRPVPPASNPPAVANPSAVEKPPAADETPRPARKPPRKPPFAPR